MSVSSLHLLAEYGGCDAALLSDAAALEAILRRAAAAAGVTVLAVAFHRFSPLGVSGVLLLAESHLSIHTWPEDGYAAVDIYTCGAGDPEAAHALLRAELRCTRDALVLLARGVDQAPRLLRGRLLVNDERP